MIYLQKHDIARENCRKIQISFPKSKFLVSEGRVGALENRFNILSSYKLVSNQSHERYSFYLQHSAEKLSKNHFFGPKLGQTDSKPNYMYSRYQRNSLEHPKVSKSSSDKKFGFSTIFPRYVGFSKYIKYRLSD